MARSARLDGAEICHVGSRRTGTTLIVQIFSFNISAAAPILFIVGLAAFRAGPRSRIKDVGRVSIGLGLMLLSLHILLDSLAPAESAPSVRVLVNAITGDPVLCILIGAIITWAAHSSVATVLLIMSLAYAHFIEPYASLALVLGANLGSSITQCSRVQSEIIQRATAFRSATSSTGSSVFC
jgi:phosphate:Na+ symporter